MYVESCFEYLPQHENQTTKSSTSDSVVGVLYMSNGIMHKLVSSDWYILNYPDISMHAYI